MDLAGDQCPKSLKCCKCAERGKLILSGVRKTQALPLNSEGMEQACAHAAFALLFNMYHNNTRATATLRQSSRLEKNFSRFPFGSVCRVLPLRRKPHRCRTRWNAGHAACGQQTSVSKMKDILSDGSLQRAVMGQFVNNGPLLA